MYLTTIAVRNNDEKIKNHIFSGLESISSGDMRITHEEYTAGDTVFIRCGYKEGFMSKLIENRSSEDFKYLLAQVLCDVIIDNYESKILKKIIKEYYIYLTEYERELIYESVKKNLAVEDGYKDGFYGQTRRTRIIRKIMNYLKSENFLIIDGFVNFRLNDYIKELGDIVEKTVEEYIAEREYNEFIKLLRYFVEIQECKMDVVNIVPIENGGYFLIDSKNSPINCECFEELKAEIGDSEISFDDFLISTLITIAPNKVVIHDCQNFKNKELFKTITNIFYDRIELCRGCDLCGILKVNKELN
ncbi:putative sporulation protein YtxC [Lutispora thermophila]|uniref:Putative sporulation protein YtxC n=1 Tax=Lutispora thermophila DSM 19022 TaxID=1122184 RepID=A0A1M6GN38_9FIRM|nr:putative sporulation protein YtxC [Lutispora thermophila]SHJ11319.1 putative sporulation protein YtxC [Lutispora thermophila DSM 19022]